MSDELKQIADGVRFKIRWDAESCIYRVSIPNYDGGEVVKADFHDAEISRLRALAERQEKPPISVGDKVIATNYRPLTVERFESDPVIGPMAYFVEGGCWPVARLYKAALVTPESAAPKETK